MGIVFLVIQALIAIGTLAVAVIAIWGDWLRSKLLPLKLSIVPHNLRGIVTTFTDGPQVIYYYLKVANQSHWRAAENCRVMLCSIARRAPNGEFRDIPMSVPMQYVWSPARLTPPLVNVSKEWYIDFGRLTEGGPHFEPTLYWYPNNFQGYVRKDEAVRYCLQVLADGFVSERYHVFEVAWNGEWDDNLDNMAQNLTIREIRESV
jgi:hypothetical protein